MVDLTERRGRLQETVFSNTRVRFCVDDNMKPEETNWMVPL